MVLRLTLYEVSAGSIWLKINKGSSENVVANTQDTLETIVD